MVKETRGVLTVLFILLGVSIVIALVPSDVPHVPLLPRPDAVHQPVDEPARPAVERRHIDLADVDPFSPRGWTAPPVETPAVADTQIMPIAVPIETPPALSGPPVLPFQFVGRLNDEGSDVVYLTQGEHMVVARAGETIQGGYTVLSVKPTQIEFLHVATNETQVMSLPAPGG